MDRPLSSPTAPRAGELVLTSALLSLYVGLRVAAAALAIPGTFGANRGSSTRARA